MKIRAKKILLVLAVLMLAAVMLTGCTTFDNFKKAFIDKPEDKEATVRIGIYEPESGEDSEGGEIETTGIELANELYPTVDGKMVELIYSDNASDINAAETAIKDLVEKEPDVILGSYGSVYSMIAGDYIADAEIPSIAITNTNPLVTKNNNYYFRVCYVDSDQGDILARYLLESQKVKKAGILIPKDDDAAMATATSFMDRMKAVTEDEDAITSYEEYETGDDDFSAQLEEIKKSKVKYVLLTGEMTDAAHIIRQAAEMQIDVTFLGDSDWISEEFKEEAGSAANEDSVAFVKFFDAEETVTEESEIFLEAYHKKYGENSMPEDGVALGYDAYIIALDAIEKAGNDVSGDNIRKILTNRYSFEGASGEINFNNTGDPIKTAYISTWQGNRIVTLQTIEPAL